MAPVQCEHRPYHCSGPTDVEFCELQAMSVEGADCADLGLAPKKHFCFVMPAHMHCAHTNYTVKGRDCRIVEYRDIRQWSECTAGSPTFVTE